MGICTRGMLRVFGFIALGSSPRSFLGERRSRPKSASLPVCLLRFSPSFRSGGRRRPSSIPHAISLRAKHLELYGMSSFFTEWGGAIGVLDGPAGRAVFLRHHLPSILRRGEDIHSGFQYRTVFPSPLSSRISSARICGNRETGLCAGLLLLGIPYLLTQVPLMLVDVPTMFLVTLCLYTFLNTVQAGGIPDALRSHPVAIFLTLSLRNTPPGPCFSSCPSSHVRFSETVIFRGGWIILRRSIAVLATAGFSGRGLHGKIRCLYGSGQRRSAPINGRGSIAGRRALPRLFFPDPSLYQHYGGAASAFCSPSRTGMSGF